MCTKHNKTQDHLPELLENIETRLNIIFSATNVSDFREIT